MTEFDALLRVALAAALGGAIGFERELQEKSAGLRTHTLVALGAATFTVIAVRLVDLPAFAELPVRPDPSRIIQGIIGGIGFLGAAVVFRGESHPHGLTTAAGIWTVTGIGIAAALGYHVLAIGVTLLILAVLIVLKIAERTLGTR